MVERTVEIKDDPRALALRAAEVFLQSVKGAVEARGSATVALSGGSTPRLLYDVLAGDGFRDRVDWSRVLIFFSDERFVPPDSPESNFHTAELGLLSRVSVPPENIYRVPTVGVEPDEAAVRYEETVRAVVAGSPLPQFDLIFLGMGPDGHTASLFPGSTALEVTDRLVAANFVERLDTWRITFTYPLLDAGRTVVFLVAGPDKAERLPRVLRGDDYPAARVRPAAGRLYWLVDAAAASQVEGR